MKPSKWAWELFYSHKYMAFWRGIGGVGVSSSDAILNDLSHVRMPCTLLGAWLTELSSILTMAEICLERPKISNMFDFILTALQGEFLTKITPHAWGNGQQTASRGSSLNSFLTVCDGRNIFCTMAKCVRLNKQAANEEAGFDAERDKLQNMDTNRVVEFFG